VRLAHVNAVLEPLGFDLCSLSTSGFAPIFARGPVFADEGRQASLSRWCNREEGRFFPGFFTALYRRRSP
jgi:hypothetical protein